MKQTPVAAFSKINMSEGVPALRKLRVLPKKKNKHAIQTMVKEDGAPFVIPPTLIQNTVVWEKELDDLFRTLRDQKMTTRMASRSTRTRPALYTRTFR